MYYPRHIYVLNSIWVQRYAFQKCDKVFQTYYIAHKEVTLVVNRI